MFICVWISSGFVASVLVPLIGKGGHFSMRVETVYIQRVMFKVPGESLGLNKEYEVIPLLGH